MKSFGYKLWFDLLTNTLVVAIVVLLLMTSELTNEQLIRIKPGMTLKQAKDLLGAPFEGNWTSYSMAVKLEGTDNFGFKLTHFDKFFNPNLTIVYSGCSLQTPYAHWIGKTHLLWVEHNNGIVTKTWLFPITRSGGGIQGCINTLKNYWRRWTSS